MAAALSQPERVRWTATVTTRRAARAPARCRSACGPRASVPMSASVLAVAWRAECAWWRCRARPSP